MVMVLYGLTAADVITDPTGNVRPGVTGMVYNLPVGGAVFSNTFAVVEPGMIAGAGTAGQVTTNDLGRFGFFAEDYYGELWFDLEGVRWRCQPLSGQVVDHATAAIATDLQDQLDTATGAWQSQMDAMQADVDSIKALDPGKIAVNVRSYGALGDGTTNDQAAFQDAVEAIKTAGGGMLLIPPGTYLIDGVIELCSNLAIRGDGAVLKKTNYSPYAYFAALSHGLTGYGSSVRNVIVSGITFLGDFANDEGVCGFALHHAQNVVIERCRFEQAQGVGHCIDLCGCDSVIVRNCDFLGFNNYLTGGYNRTEAIEIDVSAPGAVSVADDPGSYDLLLCSNITVDHCRFLPITVGAETFPAPNPLGAHAQVEGKAYTNIRFTNNLVIDPTQDNPVDSSDNGWLVGVLHFPCVQGLWIENNTITQSQSRSQRVISVVSMSEGITAASDPDAPTNGSWAAPVQSKSIHIRGNTIKGFNPPAGGVEAYTLFLRGISAGWLEDVHVENNTISDGYQATGDLGGRAIFVRWARRVDVRGNSISNYRYGIDLNGGDTATITGNTIDQMYNWPVILTAWAGASVNANSLRRLRMPMQSQADTTEIAFVGNTVTEPQVTGNNAAGIVCAGTRSAVIGNTIRNQTGTQPRGIAMNTATSAGNVAIGNVATGYTTSVSPGTPPAGTLYSTNNPVPV